MFELHEHITRIPSVEELAQLHEKGKVVSFEVSPSRYGQKPDDIQDMTSSPTKAYKLGGRVIDGEKKKAYVIGALISYYHQDSSQAKKKLLIRAYLFEKSLSPSAKHRPSKN